MLESVEGLKRSQEQLERTVLMMSESLLVLERGQEEAAVAVKEVKAELAAVVEAGQQRELLDQAERGGEGEEGGQVPEGDRWQVRCCWWEGCT